VYGLNVAAGGFTGQMNELMTDVLKATWGPLAYLRGAVGVLPNLTDYETFITWDDGPEERIAALNIIVANGRTAAGGFMVAPTANPEDGLLDVVVVQSGSLVDLAGVAARLLVGNYVGSDLVLHRQVRHVRVAAQPGMWFNVDGELLTKDPVTFTVLPQALQVVVGKGYTPEPLPS
jgi:diacylglycerol kinase (ATP)